ncbi:terminase large subunit [Mycobacterium phage Wamburgrxpress]|uniref:Terminase large subunit n=5 Tax=Bronvirus TaxID=1623278 RepID=A0A514U540_9CAUD|nr:terminase large subunit [Mycobacterium phage Silverleaf]AYD82186.1 terminase large subunit [Mycobacterium phage Wamburgrxpress]AZS12158.1 terminase large subunit [Mycobacterium phage Acquire49]QDK04010.1 terminase large subunit [Mycobacterium phage AvadaKedavra]QGJ92410.1 terminase large subunit [Mycobacterium phage Wyatt2]QGJ93025.1 terminase large subunit [Mycobacterium phage Zaria]QOC56670.1 terminase large subunit [Mycobacterium phage Tyson]QWT30533.1 terminase large subunit [Mycobact
MAMTVIPSIPTDRTVESESDLWTPIDEKAKEWSDKGLIGAQKPRLSNYPTFFTSLEDDGMDFIEAYGYNLLPWQEALFRASLGRTKEGLWSARQVCLIVPRQQGKTELLEAREFFGLFGLNERIFHTSQQAKTNTQAWQSLTAKIDSFPDLEELMMPHKNGGEEVSIRLKKTGSNPEPGFVRYIARSPNSGRGFRDIDLVMCDEAYALTAAEIAALGPTQRANANPQTWYTSSAGTEDSEILSGIRDAGIAHANPNLLFAEWSLEDGADPADRALWPLAQPSLGAPFCTLRNLESEFIQLPFVEFAREHMGMWDDPRINSVIPFEAWEACKLEDLPNGEQPSVEVLWTVAAVDVAPDRAWASIALAGKRADGRSHVEVIAADKGTNWIVPMMQRLISSATPPRAVALQAGAQAGAFYAELQQIGYKVHMLTPSEIAAATAQFYDDVVGEKLTHLDDDALVAGLAGATKYPIGKIEHGGWGWLRKGTNVDITGIVACSYANRILTLESAEESLTKKKRYRLVGSTNGY